MTQPIRHAQRGISLVEVLIAMVILAVGLLGLVGLQGRLHIAQVESYQRAQALILLQDMQNRIVLNRNNAADYVTARAPGSGMARRVPWPMPLVPSRTCATGATQLHRCRETISGSNVGAMVGGRGCIESPGRRPVPDHRGLAGPRTDFRAACERDLRRRRVRRCRRVRRASTTCAAASSPPSSASRH